MIDIHNIDSIQYMKTLTDNSIDCIATDPPYPVTSRGTSGNSGGMMQKDLNKQGKVFEFNDVNISDYAPEFYRLLKDGSHCYVMTNHINLIEMLNTFVDCGFHFIKSLIWNKENKIMGQYYMSQFEYILFFRKGYGKPINNCGTSDILSIPNKKNKDIVEGGNLHDTEKPVKLMKILIENSTNESDVVLDPFMGVGSTGIACKESNRSFIGCEIDEHYFNIAKQRIESVKEFNINKLKENNQMKLLNRINKG
ncbi:MAG: site-specific DNA-methyltransferase [Bacilli bacterium]|nr:site-specific DNA-methyltransferase [Bacilli bacterium]